MTPHQGISYSHRRWIGFQFVPNWQKPQVSVVIRLLSSGRMQFRLRCGIVLSDLICKQQFHPADFSFQKGSIPSQKPFHWWTGLSNADSQQMFRATGNAGRKFIGENHQKGFLYHFISLKPIAFVISRMDCQTRWICSPFLITVCGIIGGSCTLQCTGSDRICFRDKKEMLLPLHDAFGERKLLVTGIWQEVVASWCEFIRRHLDRG